MNKVIFSTSLGVVAIMLTIGSVQAKETIASAQNRPSLKSSSTKEQYTLTLDDVRDTGLTLQQIKNEAVHIYLEATRKPVAPDADPKLIEPRIITAADFSPDKSNLPVRREWIAFFVGSMEPIIHLLVEDISAVENETKKLVLPNGDDAKVTEDWKEWAQAVKDLNTETDKMSDILNSDKMVNKAIAEQAIAIYNTAQKAEDTRVKVHKLVQECAK
jgi:hypothetical protein